MQALSRTFCRRNPIFSSRTPCGVQRTGVPDDSVDDTSTRPRDLRMESGSTRSRMLQRTAPPAPGRDGTHRRAPASGSGGPGGPVDAGRRGHSSNPSGRPCPTAHRKLRSERQPRPFQIHGTLAPDDARRSAPVLAEPGSLQVLDRPHSAVQISARDASHGALSSTHSSSSPSKAGTGLVPGSTPLQASTERRVLSGPSLQGEITIVVPRLGTLVLNVGPVASVEAVWRTRLARQATDRLRKMLHTHGCALREKPAPSGEPGPSLQTPDRSSS